MQTNIVDISVDLIDPSPYQHRRTFSSSKLQELANSIARDGLIQPIVLRSPNGNGRYELIAGERRWRAVQLVNYPTILSRLVDVTDIQARRMCAAENLQREDLSAIEEVSAIVEMVDAELIEDEDYQRLGETPVERVKWLLGRLFRQNDYVYLVNKFVDRVTIIFSSLPKPLDWRAFYNHDLPLVTNIDEVVAEFSALNKLNKSQTKETQRLKNSAPKVFEDIRQSVNDGEKAVIEIGLFNPQTVEYSDLSAREMVDLRRGTGIVGERSNLGDVHFSSETPEWYTPKHIIDRVLKVMEQIDLDPCSNDKGSPNVPACQHYTQEDSGLSYEWRGRVYMNPPYGDVITDWINHLVKEWDADRLTEAIALVPARTDTVWFRWLRRFPRCFVWGRLKFSESENSAPFPSVVVYLGENLEQFVSAFSDIGDIYQWTNGNIVSQNEQNG